MKLVTLFFLIFSTIFTLSAFTKRPQELTYEKVDGLAPISRPIYGAQIFNSADEMVSFSMAKAVIKKDSQPFNFEKSSLLAIWLGKPEEGRCLWIESVNMTDSVIVAYGKDVACSQDWTAPYIYYKLPKTDKKAELIIVK